MSRLALGAVLLATLLYFLGPDWGAVRDQFKFHVGYFGLGFLGTALATAFTAARWRLLNERMTETRLPYGSYFHYVAVTRFIGQFAPMLLMEFVGRGMGLRAAGSKQGLGRLVTPVLLERVLDAALPCTTLAWLFLVLEGPPVFSEYRWFWLVGITVGFAVAAIPFIGPTANVLLKAYAWVKKFRGAVLVIEPVDVSARTSAWVALYSVGRYATVLLQFIGMGAAAGAVLSTFSVVGSFSVAQLSALLAITPGGLGIQDVGWAGALKWLGAEKVTITLFVFGFRASMISNFGLVSLLSLPLRKSKT
ncbi:MAG: lysylphosphatidylglycerol synthase domain-containing protein [Nannocystales bacterium]